MPAAPSQVGPPGPKGDPGGEGPAGDQGPKGDTGAAGAAGAQGPKGEKGDTGAQGVAGEQGPKGDKGDTGAAGAAGPQGVKGEKGDTGAKGEQGIQGVQGEKGAKGDLGPQGVEGPAGPQGAKGDVGAQGPKGDTGAKGEKGDTGAAGPTNLITVVKTESQNLAKENTVLQDITGLDVAIGASATEILKVIYWLFVEGASGVADLKVGFASPGGGALPAGLTGRWGGIGGTGVQIDSAPVGTTPLAALTLAETFGFGTRGGVAAVPIAVFTHSGGTAGTMRIRGSQNTSDPGQVTILKDSFAEILKVAT